MFSTLCGPIIDAINFAFTHFQCQMMAMAEEEEGMIMIMNLVQGVSLKHFFLNPYIILNTL